MKRDQPKPKTSWNECSKLCFEGYILMNGNSPLADVGCADPHPSGFHFIVCPDIQLLIFPFHRLPQLPTASICNLLTQEFFRKQNKTQSINHPAPTANSLAPSGINILQRMFHTIFHRNPMGLNSSCPLW